MTYWTDPVEMVYSFKDMTDDICLIAVVKFPNTVSGLVQWALLNVETWCKEVGLSVNVDKTGLLAFIMKRKLPGFFEPQFFGVKPRLPGRSSVWEFLWILG
jgi:hypothetical protein